MTYHIKYIFVLHQTISSGTARATASLVTQSYIQCSNLTKPFSFEFFNHIPMLIVLNALRNVGQIHGFS